MRDSEVLFARGCGRRGAMLYACTLGPIVLLIASFFVMGWNDTRGQTALLIVMGVCFLGAAVYGIAERVEVRCGVLRRRHFWWWSTAQLPPAIRCEPAPDQNPYASVARAALAAPPSIRILDAATGSVVAEIGFDMLAGMDQDEYGMVLERLSRSGRTSGCS